PESILVEVRDTQAPTLAVAAAPAILWPPDGRQVEVTLQIAAGDRCDPSPRVTLLEARSSEPDARAGASIAGAAPGTDDRSVLLKAERAANGPGRTYTITYRTTDASGNAAIASAVVQVPHDDRR